MNDRWNPGCRWSVHKAAVAEQIPIARRYYEKRRVGKGNEKSFEDWGGFESEAEREHFKSVEVKHAFFPMDYSHGFTGRGGKCSLPQFTRSCCFAYKRLVSSEAMEQPGLVGPRNETVGDLAASVRESDVQYSRRLWQKSDQHNAGPLGGSKDDDDVGPLGESRDEEEEVGPFGESRAEEEGEDSDARERKRELRQLAATSIAMLAGWPAEEEDAPSSHTARLLQTQPQAPLTSSSPPIDSASSTSSRKRARSSKEDAEDNEFLSRQKRKRMDDVYGIIRNDPAAGKATQSGEKVMTPSAPSRKRVRGSTEDEKDGESQLRQKRMRNDAGEGATSNLANAAKTPQTVGIVVTPDAQGSKKRARSIDDDKEGGATKPKRKCLRLYQRIKEIPAAEEEYVTANRTHIANRDNSTLVCYDTPSSEAQEPVTVDRAPGNTASHQRPSVKAEESGNEGEALRESASKHDEAAPVKEEWDTAHGILSRCANIRVPGKVVSDVTGVLRHLHLPTCTGAPDRAWSEKDKEDLRAYIQDYGVESWTLLSQSTNRPPAPLQDMYLEVVAARNKHAGRPENDGIPEAYPNLAAPPPPPPKEPRNLRDRTVMSRVKRNMLGDLKYSLKAVSFPKTARDGRIVDLKGRNLLGVMDSISFATKPRQSRPKPAVPQRVAPYTEYDDSESGVEEGEVNEGSGSAQRASAPSARGEEGPVGEENDPRVACVENEEADPAIKQEAEDPPIKQEEEDPPIKQEEEDPPIKQEEEDPPIKQEEADPAIKQQEGSDQEDRKPALTAPEAEETSAKGPLGPRFAGVSKLAGASRRGVPRKAAGLRK